jgi:O-succinylbenzoic acid--CoA ligase
MFEININDHTYTLESLPQHSNMMEGNEAIKLIKEWINPTITHIQFQTSGSTGVPKNISFKKEVIKKAIQRSNIFFNITHHTKIAIPLSINKTGGRMLLLRALEANCFIKILTPQLTYPEGTFHQMDFVSLSPNQMFHLYNHRDLNEVPQILLGGAPLPEGLEKNIIQTCTNKVYHSYGMTETLSHIAIRSITPINQAYYQPLEEIKIKTNENNCLMIYDPILSDEWIVSNDLVDLFPNNQFDFIGRYDDIINSGGIKINPLLIEKKLASIIQQPFIISSIPDETLGEKLILIIEGEIKNSIQIKEYIAIELTKYHQPKDIYQGSILLNAAGKVDRKLSKENITLFKG